MDSVNNAPKFGGDAWLELQAFKTRQINRREKLNRHKEIINGFSSHTQATTAITSSSASNSNSVLPSSALANDHLRGSETDVSQDDRLENREVDKPPLGELSQEDSNNHHHQHVSDYQCQNLIGIDIVECLLLLKLCDVALKLPIDSRSLLRSIAKVKGCEQTSQASIENLLQKFAHQELITIEEPSSVLSQCNKQTLDDQDDELCTYVISADHTKLVELDRAFGSSDNIRALLLDTRFDELNAGDETDLNLRQNPVPIQSVRSHQLDVPTTSSSDGTFIAPSRQYANFSGKASNSGKLSEPDVKKYYAIDDVESLLSLSSTREKESKKLGEELLELLSKPTAKEKNLLERFRSADGYQVQEFCPKGTKDECRRNSKAKQACDKLHFKKIIAKHTEESLGDCSFLNTCFHMDSCKYVHYEVDYDSKHVRQPASRKSGKGKNRNTPTTESSSVSLLQSSSTNQSACPNATSTAAMDRTKAEAKDSLAQLSIGASNTASKFTLSPEEQARIDAKNRKRYKTVLYPPQWIQCDLRYFDMSLLGKFSVVMADPPWDIHMELPYGTMSDDEMRKLNIPALQDEGVIFLWVTGRAMELGRECLALWGYERCDEIIWVKTNQLQRIIRTGRTGHWLNHGKEHCLVGIKGNPTGINRGLDCDIIVAEVRATSHKPDEIYGIIERLSPGTRKIELFGRAHNVQPNWITLGNQLDGVRLVEPSLIEAFKKLNLPCPTNEQAQ